MGIYTVTLPDIGEGVVEGEVIEWLKKIGDVVKQDEPIVVVMTDKATVELPAPVPGTLAKQYYQPGQIAHLGKPLYDLESESVQTQQKEEKRAESSEKSPPKKETHPEPRRDALKENVGEALAIPAVRKLARDLGIDLNQVRGTGPQGRVLLEDLKRPSSSPPLRKGEDDDAVTLVGIEHQMALQMKASHDTVAQFSYFEQADATRLIQLKERIKDEAAGEGIKMTFMPLLIKALSLTLERYPKVNSSYDASANTLLIHKHHNIGIAFSTERGLIVPVLKDVQLLKLPEIVRRFEALKQKAAQNSLEPSDMRDGTITISNYGALNGGGLFATPLIRPPEVSILAIAKIQKLPFVKNNQVVARDLLNLSWTFDHRVISGEMAASFSHHFASLIHNPAALL